MAYNMMPNPREVILHPAFPVKKGKPDLALSIFTFSCTKTGGSARGDSFRVRGTFGTWFWSSSGGVQVQPQGLKAFRMGR